jgi:FkbM family methyltransferase
VRYLDWQRRRALNAFPFEQRIAGSRILAANRCDGVSALIHVLGMYDYNNMRFLQSLLSTVPMDFFDIGANIGPYSLIASEIPGVRVWAFEPHPTTYSRLERSLSLNRGRRVRAFQVALADRDESVVLTDSAASAGNRIVYSNDECGITVDAIRGDSLCEREQLSAPRCMKIDVEGYEAAVLRGFGGLLKEVDVILIERSKLAAQYSFGTETSVEILSGVGLAGPYWVDIERCRLTSDPGGEDEVWLSASGVRMVGLGLGFSGLSR